MLTTFFSFRGRINRRRYWLRLLALVAISVFASIVLLFALGVGEDETVITDSLAVIGLLVFYVVVVISSLSISARRLHDRNKSGWWLVLFVVAPSALQSMAQPMPEGLARAALTLIGAILSIWALVELGFLRGTEGPNDYGPDPLAPEEERKTPTMQWGRAGGDGERAATRK